jgi:putative ABC transport system permease protein
VFASLRQNRGRAVLSVLAIALGVALGYAVQAIHLVAIGEMDRAARALAGEADLQLTGPRSGFDESLYGALATHPMVKVASPVVELDLRITEAAGRPIAGSLGGVAGGGAGGMSLRALGMDVFRAAQLQPAMAMAQDGDQPAGAMDWLRGDRVFLSQSAADALDVKAGDALRVPLGLGSTELVVAGILPPAAYAERIALMDIAGAQQLAQRLGRLNRIDLRLADGASAEALKAAFAGKLPPDTWLETPAAGVARAAGLSRSYRVNLNVLALVALFTGGLLVFSTQALAVVRRRGQFALLRVLGVTRGGILRMVLGESALLGVAGAGLGLLAGHGLAALVLDKVGADLGAGMFRGLGAGAHLGVDPWSAAVFFLLGLGVTLAGSAAAAIEAARTSPSQALHAGDEQRAFERIAPSWPGVALFVSGALMTLAPPLGELPVLGYLSIALMLVGSILLMPRLTLLVFRRLPVPRAASVALAIRQVAGSPGQAMVSLASIVASVSLMVSMAIMVASFRLSLDAWLDQVLPADLYARTAPGADSAFLSPEDQAKLAALPGVRRVEFQRVQRITLGQQSAGVLLLARDLDMNDVTRGLPLLDGPVANDPKPAGLPPVWITESIVDRLGWQRGQAVMLPLAGSERGFRVAGVWRDYARQQGAVLITRADWQRYGGDALANDAAFWLEAGAANAVRDALRALPGGEALDVAEPGDIRAVSLKIFDRTFAVTYALEAAAVLLGLAGLSASFGALVLSRRREFGMLRHLGMTRRQVGAMLAAEGAMVSALGLAVGVFLGWLISLVLIHVVNRQSFHWSMEVHMPWASLAGFVGTMLVLATLTSVLAGRQAMGGDAVRAVREDW